MRPENILGFQPCSESSAKNKKSPARNGGKEVSAYQRRESSGRTKRGSNRLLTLSALQQLDPNSVWKMK